MFVLDFYLSVVMLDLCVYVCVKECMRSIRSCMYVVRTHARLELKGINPADLCRCEKRGKKQESKALANDEGQ